MVTTSSTDLGTLGWVKDEIDETLKQARLALEAFSEQRTDEAKLRLCATYLHQVGGTLKMVELDVLALLVEEAEAAVQALLQGVEAPSEAVLEPLARVILSLPDMLDRVQAQGLGDGLFLLPLANELRGARGIEPLKPQAFFTPDLSVRPPVSPVADDSGFAAIFRKQRSRFQGMLLKWLKGLGSVADGRAMSETLETWRAAVAFAPLAQCLWVASAFVRFVTAQAEPSLESKKLLGRLDQLLRRFADGQDKGGVRAGCERLTRDMLFVLREGPSEESAVLLIRAAFALGGEAADLSIPSGAALRSMASALSQELALGQSLLSTCFDPGQKTGATRDGELVQLLEKMAKTFSVLGIAPLEGLLQDAVGVCRAVSEGRLEKSGAVAMALAQTLLQIESATREVPSGRGGWELGIKERRQALASLLGVVDTSGVEVSEVPLSEQDRRQLIGAVGGEICANLKQIEERFLAFVAAAGDRELLAGLPALAAQVEAAFQVVEESRAAELARGLHALLLCFSSGQLTPKAASLEALAAAVAGLEAEVVGLERGRPLPEAQLTALTEALYAVVGEQGLRVTEGSESAPVIASGARAASVAPAPSGTADHPAIDPEILPVFLEDAHQALRQLEEALPAWDANAADEEAIGLARRAFHTLKGSGRMVEAGEIAELAYDAEMLFNKIRGRQREASVGCRHWIRAAYEIVRDWVVALEKGGSLPYMAATRAALQALVDGCEDSVAEARAEASVPSETFALAPTVDTEAWATGGLTAPNQETAPPVFSGTLDPGPAEFTPPEYQSEPDSLPDRAAALEPAGASPLADDVVLYDIFVAETQDHLAVLREAATSGPEALVSAVLLRVVHTMQGSARSVALGSMAEACAGLERYLQALELRQEPLGTEGTELLADLVEASETFLAALAVNRTASPDFAAVTTRLTNLFKSAQPTSALTWWQKNLELQETKEETVPVTTDLSTVPPSPQLNVTESPAPHRQESARAPSYAAPPAEAPTEAIDPELREIFRDEAHELLSTFETALGDWRAQRQNETLLQSLKRALHTLKGGARMCGVFRMGDFAHATEELLRRVEDGSCARDDQLFALLDTAAERLGGLYDDFLAGRSPPLAPADRDLLARLSGESSPAPDSVEVVESAVLEPVAAKEREVSADPPSTTVSEPTTLEDEAFKPEVATQVRVRTALLDRLVNYAGEVSIARSRMEQQVFSLREHLAELNGNVKRFRDQVRELEIQAESQIVFRTQVGEGNAAQDFDPLEFDRFSRLQQLSRGLTENLHDLITLHGTLDSVASQAEAVLQQQARVNTELQEGLMRTRMVGFATQGHRLRQIVRQTSREINKRAELVLSGVDVELDRHLLERMIAPFEHMIRNALDHGLESAAERQRLGKPAVGTIAIHAMQESGEIVIRFSDDGAGLNIERIRSKAIERKLVPPNVVVSDEQVMQFILLPGFSTASQITHLSGRGVGMDVVHSEVKKLGGAITVDTKAGRGTTFIIRLPLTLSITQALVVSCADQLFAVPLAAIINIVEAPGGAIQDALLQEHPTLRYGGRDYPFMDLTTRLGLVRGPDLPRKLPVLLLRLDAREIAVAVDDLSGTREVVVKPLGPQLAEIRGLFGATILGDGRVLLILDIPALWTEGDGLRLAAAPVEVPVAARPYVLVVDDSLTVRKVTSRFLQKQGYDVETAKDGIEALEQLRDRIPDVMLVDIEMPRMDGYELTSRIRDEPRLNRIPIIMITSRSGMKHRERAMSLGVDVYLGKPYQEDDLRKEIETLLRRGRP